MKWNIYIYRVWFILVLKCGFYQNNNILFQQHWSQGLHMASHIDRYPFSASGPSKGHENDKLKKKKFFFTLDS